MTRRGIHSASCHAMTANSAPPIACAVTVPAVRQVRVRTAVTYLTACVGWIRLIELVKRWVLSSQLTSK